MSLITPEMLPPDVSVRLSAVEERTITGQQMSVYGEAVLDVSNGLWKVTQRFVIASLEACPVIGDDFLQPQGGG